MLITSASTLRGKGGKLEKKGKKKQKKTNSK